MSNLFKNYSYEYPLIHKYLKKILIKQRKKFYEIFCKNIKIEKNYKILDVGTSNTNNDYDNFLLNYYPFKKNITCLSNQELDLVKKNFPDVNILVGDGREIKISNNEFDIVFSNAVIEHVGCFENQLNFISECIRVSRKFIFIITPYRFFPIEMHTKIPLLHFLPKKIFRKFLIFLGDNFLSKEENLNLLTEKELVYMCDKLKIKKFKIIYSHFFGFKSNIILRIEK